MAGYSPWDRKESDTPERLKQQQQERVGEDKARYRVQFA